MDAALAALPDDVDALKAALLAARAETAIAIAEQSSNRALIAHLKLQIEKLNRDRFGPRSERTARLLDQMELQLEELEATATEDELAAETAAAKTTTVAGFTRARPARRPFPEHLPRERVVVPGPVACACCGGPRLSKLGEDVTETLEVVPRTWKVIQHVREKFSCRDCERISQPPAPFHVTPRGWAGPNLLAMMLFEKFGQHQPLNRQAERYGREGVPFRPIDAGRSGRRLHDRADAAVLPIASPCHGRRAAARRRYHRAGARPGQDRHRPPLDLRA